MPRGLRGSVWAAILATAVAAAAAEPSLASSPPERVAEGGEDGLSPVGNLGPAQLTIEGDVRTTDPSGDPRLWGAGRPGTLVYRTNEDTGTTCRNGPIKFGLSKHMITWGSAAQACPAGTWVCKEDEIIPCDTDRPDQTVDAYLCDASAFTNRPPEDHWGWVADVAAGLTHGGLVLGEETGLVGDAPNCFRMPVWCCWE